MKKFSALFLSLLLLIPAIGLNFGGANAAGDIFVIDDFEDGGTNIPGGFEPGAAPEWEATDVLTITLDNTVSKNGNRSLKLDKTDAGIMNHMAQTTRSDLTISTAGTTHMQFWIKTSGLTDGTAYAARIRFFTDDGGNWYNYGGVLNATNTNADFVLVSLPLTDFGDYGGGDNYNPAVDSTTITRILIILVGDPFSTPVVPFTAWIDDIALVPSDTFVVDDFETGGTNVAGGYESGPDHEWGADDPFTVSIDNTVSKNGSSSLKLEKTDNGFLDHEVRTVANNLAINAAGKTYFQFWLKTAELPADTEYLVRVRFRTSDGYWYNHNTIMNSSATNAEFVLVSLPLTDFGEYNDVTGLIRYDPEVNSTTITKFFIVLLERTVTPSVKSAPFTAWIDDIALVKPPSECTVTFDSDGGSAVETQTVPIGEKAVKPADPTKDNFRFIEWQMDYSGTKITFDFNTAINQDITLIAKWEPRQAGSFYVTFDSGGGSAVEEQTVASGGKAAKPADPTRRDFKFVEWRYENGGTMAAFDFNTAITRDYTLVAAWEVYIPPAPVPDLSGECLIIQDFENYVGKDQDDNTVGGFKIENPDCGEAVLETNAANAYKGSKALRMDFSGAMGYIGVNAENELLGDVDMKGYTHLEIWLKTEPCETIYSFDVRIRFYIGGQWFIAAQTVHKTYTDQEWVQVRILLTDFKVQMNNDLIIPYDPESDGTVPWMWQIDMPLNTGEEFGVWLDDFALVKVEGIDTSVRYLVSFNTLGGSDVEDQRVVEGEKVIKPADPTRDGYDFVSWQIATGEYDDDGFAVYKDYDFDTPVTENLMLRALWKESGSSGKNPVTGTGAFCLSMVAALSLSGVIFFRKKKRAEG